MLTPELRKKIDEKWEACWPISLLKPVAILDLISYLFFLKKISENHLISGETGNRQDSNLFHTKEEGGIESGAFNEQEPENVQALFSSEKGNIELLKNYARSLTYGAFVKGGLMITPTQKLLANTVAIIKIIEDEAEDKKGAIFEYLLNKKELNGPNGQAYLPENLVNLIVSIIKPNEKDALLDVAAGNGGLLVASAKYIASKNFKYNPDSRRFVGLESDLTSIRIAAMNMILQGINNPELKVPDTFSGLGSVIVEKPTVIVANLIFSNAESKMIVEGASIKETPRKEILYLNFITKNAGPGARIIAIVPDTILYNNGAEFLATRQEIMDHFRVEAVISLSDKTIAQFFGASILVFSKEAPAIGGKIWFYKMEYCGQELGPGEDNVVSGNNVLQDNDRILRQSGELELILNHFNNDGNKKNMDSPDSFYIDARDIRAKNYNLSYSEYNLFIDQQNAINLSESTSAEKKVAMANLRSQTQFRAAEVLPDLPKNYIKRIVLIVCLSLIVLGTGFGAYWFFYLKKDFFNLKEHATKPAAIMDSVKAATVPILPDTTAGETSNTSNVISKRSSSNVKKPEGAPNIKTRYEVVSDKAYFYYAPDTNARKKIYINNLVHAVLIPEKEKNAFVYVVYINKRGESTRGWLNKNDLKLLP